MVATKKAPTPAKKAAAKAAPASSDDTEKTSKTAEAKAAAEKARAERAERDADLMAQVVAMRADDTSWSEIADTLEISQGKAMFLEMVAVVSKTPKLRIKGDTDEDLAPLIVEARQAEEYNSWGWIAARSGLGEAKCRSLFKEGGGGEWLGHRIGRGGRFPGDVNPNPDAGGTKATKTSSSKTAKSAEDRNPDKVPIGDMTLSQLKVRFNDGVGFSYKNSDGKIVKQKVKSVSKLANGTMTFTGMDDGKQHAVKLESITKVDR